jgi:hypothetical protein
MSTAARPRRAKSHGSAVALARRPRSGPVERRTWALP